MQKYLRHFPLLRRKRCLRGHVHAIPPTPLIKVASDAKPYSKLQPTTLNGGEGGAVCILLMICIICGAFLLGGLLFSRSVSTILQLVVAYVAGVQRGGMGEIEYERPTIALRALVALPTRIQFAPSLPFVRRPRRLAKSMSKLVNSLGSKYTSVSVLRVPLDLVRASQTVPSAFHQVYLVIRWKPLMLALMGGEKHYEMNLS